MKAGAICGIPNEVRILTVDEPHVGPDDVIVKPKRIGLCMTNVKMARHGYYAIDQRGLPFIEGHEVAGEVVKVGKNVGEYAPGDRVVVYVYVPCHNCRYCRNGHPTMCEQFILGGIYPGGWAEYVKVSRADDFSRRLHRIADGVSYDHAAMLEPLSCVVHSVDRANLKLGQNVVVIGAGFMGLLHTALLSRYPLSMNASIDLSGFRLQYAESLGATHTVQNTDANNSVQEFFDLTGGYGADVVFEVTGNVQAYELAVRLLGKGGRAVFFGGTPSSDPMRVNPRALHYDMLQLIGVQSAEDQHVVQAMNLINTGSLKLDGLITHRFKMDELKDAILFPQDPDNRERMVKTMVYGFDEDQTGA
jgi:L-iditol 2-dehydrogenase